MGRTIGTMAASVDFQARQSNIKATNPVFIIFL
jgi:hypothetical protein